MLYRYRTPALVGPWRDSRQEAEADAVAMGQAERAGPEARFRWKVAGSIEAENRRAPDSAERQAAGAARRAP